MATTFYQDMPGPAAIAALNQLWDGMQAAGLASPVAIAQGGTAGTTAATARANLGIGTPTYPLMNYGGFKLDGTTHYLDTNALTGIADGKAGTLVIALRFANAAGTLEQIVHNTGPRFSMWRTTGGDITVEAYNVAGTKIMSFTSNTAPCAAAGTYVIMVSWNLLTAATGRLYVNDVSVYNTETTYTNDTIDYTVTEWSIGATVTGTSKMTGDLYAVWFDPTQRLEFNTASVRRAFSDFNNALVFMGRAGELPTGTAPGLFHAYDDSDLWTRNRGSFTSSWTVNGTAANPTTQINGQYVDLQEIGLPTTITANYTVSRTDTHIISNRGATNTITLPSASANKGREITIKTIQAFTVVSASSNVAPMASATLGTAILAATAGAWLRLKSDGAGWVGIGA